MMAKPAGEPPAGTHLPLSRPLRVQDVPDKTSLSRRIEATPAERAAIAADGGLVAIAALVADFQVARRANGRFEVTGRLDADVTERCVVTLEPFETKLHQEISIAFALPPPRAPREPDVKQQDVKQIAVVEFAEGEDPPDPIVGNMIDLGSVALEFLTLARDFYPKKPGVEFAGVVSAGDDTTEPSHFAALERFKDQS